ncbi:hypothetical protein SAMN02745216_02345 [Desulfatibacillum alkenivorans DSM 16219]|uniref:Uncharacterized protein n=1 Tax=Desulfatibacillum alkenivorans DSM 16219 TaxID=1121393 RepID=A0A1M6MFG3_9BACT|nr:hypothetical protein [Desulfatibacillum alkenivorans]SHJ82205.1 hypothetical protein SAMN02745216_02345 [Desulfatibacillum alkenivorans DSM 16219]
MAIGIDNILYYIYILCSPEDSTRRTPLGTGYMDRTGLGRCMGCIKTLFWVGAAVGLAMMIGKL